MNRNAPMSFSEPVSPCIRLCRVDERTGLCSGCLRALDEISAWAAASDDERRAILERVEQRRREWKK